MTEFSDRLFAAGSLTGIRSWRVDRYGRLLASQINAVWTPGENVGRCFKDRFSGGVVYHGSTVKYTFDPTTGYGYATPSLTGASILSAPRFEQYTPPCDKHTPGALSCKCGFYAYFDNGPNAYHEGGNVLGLIEGYGVTTVGTRGFRSEKARIQAFIIKPRDRVGLTARVLANYPDVPVFERKREAFEQFPLTPPDFPLPESDPEFWTREVL